MPRLDGPLIAIILSAGVAFFVLDLDPEAEPENDLATDTISCCPGCCYCERGKPIDSDVDDSCADRCFLDRWLGLNAMRGNDWLWDCYDRPERERCLAVERQRVLEATEQGVHPWLYRSPIRVRARYDANRLRDMLRDGAIER